jgi:hypothetical protein
LPKQSVVFCYASADAALAREAGTYLERNLPLQAYYEEGLVRPGFDLVDAAARGLSAEWAILLFSPDSWPKPLERERWEPVFLEQPRDFGSNVIFAQVRECRFPALLRRQSFVDFVPEVTAGLREMKRIVIKQRALTGNPFDLPKLPEGLESPSFERIRNALADAPGTLQGVDSGEALHFAHNAKDQFEGAFWIDCPRRTPAGILGDTAQALGLTLTGALEQNTAALREFCTQRRCLFVFENLPEQDRSLVEFGGLASVITTAANPARPLLPLNDTAELFKRWHLRPMECRAHLGDAYEHLRQGASAVGASMLALLKNHERLAEANEVLELLIAGAESHGDTEGAMRLKWDRSWILGHWGEPYGPIVGPLEPLRQGTQLGFDFG